MGETNKIRGGEAPAQPTLLANLNLPRTAPANNRTAPSPFDWGGYATSQYTNSQLSYISQPSRPPRDTNLRYLAPAIILSLLSGGGLAAGAASASTCKNPSDCRDSSGTLFGITAVITGAAVYCFVKTFPPAN